MPVWGKSEDHSVEMLMEMLEPSTPLPEAQSYQILYGAFYVGNQEDKLNVVAEMAFWKGRWGALCAGGKPCENVLHVKGVWNI